jgi:hypothetical protein
VNNIVEITAKRTGEEVIGFRSIKEGNVVCRNVQNINAGKKDFKNSDPRGSAFLGGFGFVLQFKKYIYCYP